MKNGGEYRLFIPIILTFIAVFTPIFLQAIISEDFILSPYSLYSMVVLLIMGIYMLIFGFRKPINSTIWKSSYKKRLSSRKIGILLEKGCKSNATDFTPSYWFNLLKKRYKTEYLPFSKIDNDFIAVINPYGEVYWEDDYTHFGTFNKIREYVQNGGIFVNVGGVGFWYAWNKKWERSISTAKEIYGFAGPVKLGKINQQIVPIEVNLGPTVQIGNHSLTDTLTYKNFKMLTTVGRPRPLSVYQTDDDIKFCGKIENIGGKDIVEFRAAREPMPKCYPMLRAYIYDIHKNRRIIYPLVAIPDGQGLFIFAGMAFNFKKRTYYEIIKGKKVKKVTSPVNKRMAKNQVKKVIAGLDTIISKETLLKIERKEV